MRMTDLIARKRDGGALSRDEIHFLVSGVTDGSLPDYQIAAWLMATLLRGMTDQETAWLTDAMARSGGRVDLSSIPGVKVGKHSTGGVGDKTSVAVGPLVAACGVAVPKSSGRALGHSGGTIDKLESIPGFRVTLSSREFLAQVAAIGCAFTGQTAEIAPADKKLYGLRDVTATIESLPLIASSIMSKKIAEGTDAIVLDVKVGGGAFMKTADEARALARRMVASGGEAGLRTEALLTAMDAPLGRAVGNALEIAECVDMLRGRGPADLETLVVALAARMVRLGGAAPTVEAAEVRVREALRTGAGLERLRQVIAAQGGDARVVDDTGRLPQAAAREVITARRTGFVEAIDASAIGRASMLLGAGRTRVGAAIDHGAGIVVHAKPGEPVAAGEPVLELHVGADADLDAARALAAGAFRIGDAPPASRPLVIDVVTAPA